MVTIRNLKQIYEALQRPGRMDRTHLQQPTQTEREKILLTAAKETMDDGIINFVDWTKVIMANLPFILNILLTVSNCYMVIILG